MASMLTDEYHRYKDKCKRFYDKFEKEMENLKNNRR